jgi:hypothetical protein
MKAPTKEHIRKNNKKCDHRSLVAACMLKNSVQQSAYRPGGARSNIGSAAPAASDRG